MDSSSEASSSPALSESGVAPTLQLRRIHKILLGIVAALVVSGGIGFAFVLRAPARDVPLPNALAGEPRQEQKAGADTVSVIGNPTANQVAVPTKAPADPRLSFLMLGYGGGSHDGAFLTDSIMIAVADPRQKTMTMLSIPRDSWTPLMFDGETAVYNKLNTAYAFAMDNSLYRNRLDKYKGGNGAGTFTKDTVSRLLGLPIANYFALDFVGFREMINTMGGIDVDVPASFSAQYPANDNPSIDPSWMIVRFTRGTEHMNGERAIQFARAREVIDNPSESNDFARSRRQRLIIEAFKARLFAAGGLIHLPQLLATASSHVDTDYSLPAVTQLGDFLLDWKNVRIYQTAVTTDNYLEPGVGPGGTYLLTPTAPDHSWAQIRAFARRLWQDPASGVAMAENTIVVVNNTGQPGLAGQLSEALVKMGYRVGPPQNGTLRADSRLVDRTAGRAKPLIQQLQQDLGTQFQDVAQSPAVQTNELVLELGTDDAGLADIVVPSDEEAPSSATGVQSSGGWSPSIDPAPVSESPTPASPTALPRSSATVLPMSTVTATLTRPTITATPVKTLPPASTPTTSASRTPTHAASTPSPLPSSTPTPTHPTSTPSPLPTRTPTTAHPSPTSTVTRTATHTAPLPTSTATRTAVLLTPTATATKTA